MKGLDTCGCVVNALVEMAPDPETEPGRYFVCRSHEQMIVWDGCHWRWSNQPEDITELPRRRTPPTPPPCGLIPDTKSTQE